MLLSVLVLVLLSVLTTALEASFAWALPVPALWVDVAVAVWLIESLLSAPLVFVGFAHSGALALNIRATAEAMIVFFIRTLLISQGERARQTPTPRRGNVRVQATCRRTAHP